MWDRPNQPIVRTALILTAASGAPTASGQVSLWNQSGTLQCRTPGGQDLAFGGDIFTVPLDLASCRSGNIVARQFPAFAGVVTRADFQFTKMPTTSGRSCTIQLGVGSGSMSGGVFSLAYVSGAAMTAARTAATALTGSNSFTTSGEITATVATETDASFAEGAGVLTIFVAPTA